MGTFQRKDCDRRLSKEASCASLTLTLTLLGGHKGGVTCLSVLGDGTLVSGGADGIIKAWDLEEGGACLCSLPGSKGEITALMALKRYGAKLVSGAMGENCIRTWDLSLRKQLKRLEGHQGYVTDFSSGREGNVASASVDGTVWIWVDPGLVGGSKGGVDTTYLHILKGNKAGLRIPVWCVEHLGEGALSPTLDPDLHPNLDFNWEGRYVTAGDDHLLRVWGDEGEFEQVADHADHHIRSSTSR